MKPRVIAIRLKVTPGLRQYSSRRRNQSIE